MHPVQRPHTRHSPLLFLAAVTVTSQVTAVAVHGTRCQESTERVSSQICSSKPAPCALTFQPQQTPAPHMSVSRTQLPAGDHLTLAQGAGRGRSARLQPLLLQLPRPPALPASVASPIVQVDPVTAQVAQRVAAAALPTASPIPWLRWRPVIHSHHLSALLPP